MTSGRTEQTKFTSSAVESRPREKRTSELATSFLPVARMTWLGSKEPAEQAEPLEAQIPSMSRPAIKAMPSEPLTVKETVFEREAEAGETSSQPGILETQKISWSTNGFNESRLKTGGLMNFSRALTRPKMAGRFSVPARLSFSCPPPNKMGSGCKGDLM